MRAVGRLRQVARFVDVIILLKNLSRRALTDRPDDVRVFIVRAIDMKYDEVRLKRIEVSLGCLDQKLRGVSADGAILDDQICIREARPEVIGAEVPQDRPIDGVDLAPVLFGGKGEVRDAFFFYRGEDLFAVRKGRFKAHVLTQKGYGQAMPEMHDPPLLFDLAVDPGEKFNIADQQPVIAQDLARVIEEQHAHTKLAPSQLEARAEK